MTDEPEHPADKILGADWHPPLQALVAKAWASNPERERLEQLWSERDGNGDRLWEQGVEPDPADDEFELLVLRPVDPRRAAEVVGRWLVKARTLPEDRARAIVSEHDIPPGAES
jgi:hypothetical protein